MTQLLGEPDTSTDECFDVGKASSTTATTPTHSSTVLGNTNTDSAVVTGNVTVGSPTGSVTFYVCQPTAAPTSCTSQANQVGSPVELAAGGGATSTAQSVSFTPTSTGYWCFAGYYSGDSNYCRELGHEHGRVLRRDKGSVCHHEPASSAEDSCRGNELRQRHRCR